MNSHTFLESDIIAWPRADESLQVRQMTAFAITLVSELSTILNYCFETFT
jgi:hypothetical protein